MEFEQFKRLVTQLHEKRQAEAAYLEPLPVDLREFLASNTVVELLREQLELICTAAFDEHWNDVSWFINDWKPGYEIRVSKDQGRTVTGYVINDLSDYLRYAKCELFAEAK